MSGYGYIYRDYYGGGINGGRHTPKHSSRMIIANDDADTQKASKQDLHLSEKTTKQTYDSDHVYKPVIIDAEGRKHPIVSYAPSEACITETETIVPRVHAPVVTQYKYSSPAEGTMYTRPISPVHDRPQYQTRSPFIEYNKHSSLTNGTNSPFAENNKLSSPTKGNHSPFAEYNKHSSPTKVVVPLKDHGYGERPQKVEEFITKVQTDASRPNRFPLRATVWRQSPNFNKGYHGNTTGYGSDYSDLSSKESYKPSANTIRNEDYDDGYNYRRNDTPKEPTMNTSGGWNGIGTTTTAPYSRFTMPRLMGPKRDGYSDTIDSREAIRQYANSNLSSGPVGTYTATIDRR